MTDGLEVVPLSNTHNRNAFHCGTEQLDTFLKHHALQNMIAGFNSTHVLVKRSDSRILGFYSISTRSLKGPELPDQLRKKLPKYPVPTVLLSRLAVDSSEKGKGYGKLLLLDCLHRVTMISLHVGIYSIEVDAKNIAAKDFYRQFGFTELKDNFLHLHLPLKTIRKTLGL